MERRATGLLIALWGLSVLGCVDPELPARGHRSPEPELSSVSFEADVLPILTEHCLPCHGEDPHARQGELRLDTRLGATARREGGARAIEPGSPERSLAMAAIESTEPGTRMPPEGPSLSRRETLLVRQWIALGAEYSEHWSFAPPRPGAIPLASVDHFVDATLSRVGLEPSSRALPEVQLRRLSLVLTGLPPSLEELDAFLADPSDAAYEAAVERMLASDRHAEHLARDWLDHVGYGDSNGMFMDTERDTSAWREWVIAAFRDGMPLDVFVTTQLAGDLLPSPSSDDRLATGLLRLHRTTEEGGISFDEFRTLYASERAVMVGNALLGLTFQCARCHNHRADPITQSDFYRLTACFNRVRDPGGTPPVLGADAPPSLLAAGPLQREQLAAVQAELGAARAELAALELDDALAAWEASLSEPVFSAPELEVVGTAEGTTLTVEAPGQVLASGAMPDVEAWALSLRWTGALTAIRLSSMTQRGDDGVTISEIRARVVSATARRALELDVASASSGAVLAALTDGTTSLGAAVSEAPILLRFAPLELGPDERLELSIDMRKGNASTAAGVTIAASGDAAASLDASLFAAHLLPLEERTDTEHEALRAHFARFAAPVEVRSLASRAHRLSRREAELSRAPRTRVMADDDPSRVTHVLSRGDFYRPLGEVTCGVPESLARGADPAMASRAELARWMVSADNPLTARVLANRLFQLVFGRGIVASSHDFGTRGSIPSHPELLDWLTAELIGSGWDVRHVIRLLVTSEAFRRDAAARAALLEIDPDNELLARGPRRRLDAEVLRDQALFVSGLLVERLGGPSVRPYHPPGLYEQQLDVDNFPMHTYRPDVVPSRVHRRAMYTFWRRGMLLPSLALLDAPDRLGPVARREVTITPTQSLALMNEPLFVEAARNLAERAMQASGGDVEAAIDRMFRACTARLPTDEERAILRSVFDGELAEATADAGALRVLELGISDRASGAEPAAHAALTAVARTILALAETLYVE